MTGRSYPGHSQMGLENALSSLCLISLSPKEIHFAVLKYGAYVCVDWLVFFFLFCFFPFKDKGILYPYKPSYLLEILSIG